MRVGVDIDNVISTFNEELLDEFLKHHQRLGCPGEINKNAEYITRGMFPWKAGEVETFYRDNVERIVNHLGVKPGAKEYLERLRLEGHSIYLITGRDNGEHSDPYHNTKQWLEDHSIPYDKLILTGSYQDDPHGKSLRCLENHIDLMIDDSTRICEDCIAHGIPTLIMDTPYNRKTHHIKRVYEWEEIYQYITNDGRRKMNVILDTDTYNECDDQFALAYMIKNQDFFEIEAVTIAPYSHQKRGLSIAEGQDLSYQEVLKIGKWLNFDLTNMTFRGATNYVSNGYHESNEAVNNIIEVALKNNKTYIMAIGALTNVALAFEKRPEIIDRVEVIWLGGNSLLQEKNLEFNFQQDVEAVRIVFESKVTLTVIPCKNVASNLRTSIYELEFYLKNKSELCNYLVDRFFNDGYHGLQERRVIWDIAVVAYLLHPYWFTKKEISCPYIREDTSYELTSWRHTITMVSDIAVDKVFIDLFQKLGE